MTFNAECSRTPGTCAVDRTRSGDDPDSHDVTTASVTGESAVREDDGDGVVSASDSNTDASKAERLDTHGDRSGYADEYPESASNSNVLL